MTDVQVIQEPDGTITVSGGVLAQIVRRSAEQDDAVRVRRRKRLGVSVADGRARVELELAVRYGAVLPETAQRVQERVAGSLRAMCDLDAAVDVTIERLTD